jgi:hypothetical protein
MTEAPLAQRLRHHPIGLPGTGAPPLVRRASIAPNRIVESAFVLSIALLSFTDDTGEFFERVNVLQWRGGLDEPLIVPLAPAAA